MLRSSYTAIPSAAYSQGPSEFVHASACPHCLNRCFYHGRRLSLVKHVCQTGDCEGNKKRIGRMSAVGLNGHSAIDGASIAAAALVSWQTGLRLRHRRTHLCTYFSSPMLGPNPINELPADLRHRLRKNRTSEMGRTDAGDTSEEAVKSDSFQGVLRRSSLTVG